MRDKPLGETWTEAAALRQYDVLAALAHGDERERSEWLRSRLRVLYRPVERTVEDGRDVWTTRRGMLRMDTRFGGREVGMAVLCHTNRFVHHTEVLEGWAQSQTSTLDVLWRASTDPAAYIGAVLASCIPELDADVHRRAAATAAARFGSVWAAHRYLTLACAQMGPIPGVDLPLAAVCDWIVTAAETR